MFCDCRRMFPHCKINISGLVPYAKYILLVDIVPEDGFRYKVRSNYLACPATSQAPISLTVYSYPYLSSCLVWYFCLQIINCGMV